LNVDLVAEQFELVVSVQSGTARAAMLRINDGLVTNSALILGVVAASADPGGAARRAGQPGGRRRLDGGRGVHLDVRSGRVPGAAAQPRSGRPSREIPIGRRRQASRDPEQALGIYSRAVLGVNPAELARRGHRRSPRS
jgi:hypothetical protein